MKKLTIFLLIFFLLLPIIVFISKFYHTSLSDNLEKWGQFGDYLNGTFMPVIALVGIGITYYLGLLSDKRNETNINVEKLKNKPLLYISYWDGHAKIQITMTNKGIGPLTIKTYKIINTKTNKEYTSLFDAIVSINNKYDNYTGNQIERVLSSNESVVLLEFLLNDNKTSSTYESDREKIRNSLKDLKFEVSYEDVYNTAMPIYFRELSWFGRDV
jgi:hypothetical protein